MKASVCFGLLLSGVFVAAAAAVDSFTVDVVSTSGATVPVDNPTATLDVVGHLTQQANLGLAFFAYDLRVTGPQAVNLSTAAVFSPTAGVASFRQPLGYSILFDGTPSGNDLLQLGGGQNTINNVPGQSPFVPFPSGAVVFDDGTNTGVGHDPAGVVMHSVTLTLPPTVAVGEVYTVELVPNSLFANMISAFNSPDFVVDSVNGAIGASASITIASACESVPPQIVHANVAPSPSGSTSASTCSGYIDPRIENIVVATVDTPVGPDEVVFEFSEPVFAIGGGPVTMASFAVTQTGVGTPPGIAGVVQDDPNLPVYRVQLDRIIDFKEWTTVRAMVEDVCGNEISNMGDLGPAANEPDRIDVGRLPGDINQDGIVSPVDLVNLRQFLRSNSFHNDCDDVLYFDLNRNGALGDPQDLIRFRQIRLGSAPATQRWALQEMNVPQP